MKIKSLHQTNFRIIDTETHLIELDEEDVVPSVVISDLRQDINVEETIAAGDIGGILEVLEKAVDVQNAKIPDQPNTEDYADAFTSTIDFAVRGIRLFQDFCAIFPESSTSTCRNI